MLLLCTQAGAQTPKYVIYMIGDGMGLAQAYAAKQFAGELNFMEFPVQGFVTTYSASSLVTDSSAAGTALATGTKINNNVLGIDPEGNVLTTVAEIAKAKGYGAGVATSVGVNHATPAAFYGHTASRSMYDQIADQLIESKIDFAAGATFLTSGRGSRPEMFVQKAKDSGIEVFCGKEEYKSVKGKRVIYLSNNLRSSALPYAIDHKDGQTKLAEFTEGALDYLYTNYRKGFFLMIEGGKIDSSCHSNDAATTVHEVIDFAESVQLALDFYKQHPNETLIIVTADHETGGFTMGAGAYDLQPKVLASQKVSKDVLAAKIAELRRANNDNVSWAQVKNLLRETLGLWDTIPVNKMQEKAFTQVYKDTILDNSAEVDENLYSRNDMLTKAAIDYVNRMAMTTYSFGSHSGIPVPIYVIGAKAEKFRDCHDNTDLPKMILKVTGWQK